MDYLHYNQDKLENESEHGNALWFILIIIILLTILTALVTRSTNTVNQTASTEQNRIKASSLMRFSKAVEIAIQQMITKGISENNLDFSKTPNNHQNANCLEADCMVFETQGGGLAFQSPSTLISDSSFTKDWIFTAGNRVGGFGCDDNTNDCRELIMFIKDIPELLCLEINNIQKIPNPSGAPPKQQDFTEGTGFTGSFSADANNTLIGGSNPITEAPQLKNKEAGCLKEYGNGQNNNFYYQVLLAR